MKDFVSIEQPSDYDIHSNTYRSPLRPLNDLVLMKPVKFPERIGAIFVPASAENVPMLGDVIAVGPGRVSKAGRLVPTEVKPGDRCQVRHFFNNLIQIDGTEYMLCPESEILAVVDVTADYLAYSQGTIEERKKGRYV